MRNLAAWLVAICIAGSAAFAVTLTGTVTGPDGAPVCDARVWLYRSSDWPDDDSSLVARGRTDQNGQFALAAPEPTAKDEEWYAYAYFGGLSVDGWEANDPGEHTPAPIAPGADWLHRGSSALAIAKRLLTSAEEREERLLSQRYLHGQWLPVEEDW